jgi:hypothetical protein
MQGNRKLCPKENANKEKNKNETGIVFFPFFPFLCVLRPQSQVVLVGIKRLRM